MSMRKRRRPAGIAPKGWGPTWASKTQRCLDCGMLFDSATGGSPGVRVQPKPGDIAVCLHCGHLMAYGDRKGTVRPLTDEEMLDIAGDPEIIAIQKARANVMDRPK
jgi:hypothetical protein